MSTRKIEMALMMVALLGSTSVVQAGDKSAPGMALQKRSAITSFTEAASFFGKSDQAGRQLSGASRTIRGRWGDDRSQDDRGRTETDRDTPVSEYYSVSAWNSDVEGAGWTTDCAKR